MKAMCGCRVDQSPLPFSFAISTDAKRIEAESSCFLEMWQSVTLFSALVLLDDLLSPMKPQPLVRRGRSGPGRGVGAGGDGYLCLM